jgi:hypothetical protein
MPIFVGNRELVPSAHMALVEQPSGKASHRPLMELKIAT